MNRLTREILNKIDAAISRLDDEMITWVLEHACFPREIEAVRKYENGILKKYQTYAVTEDSGRDDAPFRVVFVPHYNEFGLVQNLKEEDSYLKKDQMYFMGTYGDFAETVENM